MIVKTVKFGDWSYGSFDPKDCRGRLTLDDKGVIRYHNPDLLKPFKPVSGKLTLRQEKVEKWKDRLVKAIKTSTGEDERCKALAGAKCGPFTILGTDGKRVLFERREAAPEAKDLTSAGLHETPNLKAILDWPPEFELPVRRAQVAGSEGVSTLKFTLTQGVNNGPGELLISAQSEEIEYEEPLPLCGCVWVGPPATGPEQAPAIEVLLSAGYVHDVCGIPLVLYLQGPEDPVTWATPDDRYRYVLMPIRA